MVLGSGIRSVYTIPLSEVSRLTTVARAAICPGAILITPFFQGALSLFPAVRKVEVETENTHIRRGNALAANSGPKHLVLRRQLLGLAVLALADTTLRCHHASQDPAKPCN